MTKDEIRKMSAGREMDILIARDVLGLRVTADPLALYVSASDTELRHMPFYSRDIGAAFETAEHLREILGTCKFYFIVDPKKGDNIRAIFDPLLDDGHFEASADTAPLAICRAALLAMVDRT